MHRDQRAPAVELAETYGPVVIVMDLGMPHLLAMKPAMSPRAIQARMDILISLLF
jgi:hypothetical protein